MLRESSKQVCAGVAAAMGSYGVPEEILTDNGKVFTGRFNQPPVEVLFDRVCLELVGQGQHEAVTRLRQRQLNGTEDYGSTLAKAESVNHTETVECYRARLDHAGVSSAS
jgi:hypothetical protein